MTQAVLWCLDLPIPEAGMAVDVAVDALQPDPNGK